MTVELALTPDTRWDITVADLAAATRKAGFTAVGMPMQAADGADAAALAAAGLRCHEVLALVVTADEDSTLTQAHRLAEAAATVKAQWVLTVFAAPLNSENAPVIERSAAILADAGAGMAVEFSPLGSVTSLGAALAVVDVAGTDRAGVLIDSWHFFHGDSTWEQLERVPLERIAYIQFDDALPPVSEDPWDETMNRRVMPGDGILALDRFASTLLDRGWDGLVSVEVLSAELRALPVPEFARRAYETTARYWR